MQARGAGGVDDLGEPDGAGILVFPDGIQGIGQADNQQNGQDNQKYFKLFHYSLPPSEVVSTRLSRGRSICTSSEPAVLIYSFTPGRISEMDS